MTLVCQSLRGVLTGVIQGGIQLFPLISLPRTTRLYIVGSCLLTGNRSLPFYVLSPVKGAADRPLRLGFTLPSVAQFT